MSAKSVGDYAPAGCWHQAKEAPCVGSGGGDDLRREAVHCAERSGLAGEDQSLLQGMHGIQMLALGAGGKVQSNAPMTARILRHQQQPIGPNGKDAMGT